MTLFKRQRAVRLASYYRDSTAQPTHDLYIAQLRASQPSWSKRTGINGTIKVERRMYDDKTFVLFIPDSKDDLVFAQMMLGQAENNDRIYFPDGEVSSSP